MTSDADVPASLPLDEWIARLAEPDGNPGGGSAAGVMVALSAALVHMVCAYTTNEPRAQDAAARSARLRRDALEEARIDGVLSRELGEALAAEDGAEREHRLREAAVRAAASSATLGRLALDVGVPLRTVAEVGNPHLVADTTVAADALGAGLAAALTNLRSNLLLAARHGADAADLDDGAQLAAELARAMTAFRELADRLRP